MGYGSYSSSARLSRAAAMGYSTKSAGEIFKQRSINNAMNPYGIKLRESRDSKEHPQSISIIIALDVTGSMGTVPHYLVREGLPHIMDSIMKGGVADPQILFLAVGDHECDQAPLQVGQFESSDELLDKWLTDVFLEGGGGANDGESYLLAWYFAALHTSIDCFDKRKQKGFLFTIGDEPVLKEVPAAALKAIMGEGQHQTFTADSLFNKAREMYNVYHIHIKETQSGSRQHVIDGWKQLLHDNLIVANRHEEVSGIISSRIIHDMGSKPSGPSTDDPAEKRRILL
jgi:hypothetical protein